MPLGLTSGTSARRSHSLAGAGRNRARSANGSQRPPPPHDLEIDVGAVARDDITQVFLVPERQRRRVIQGIPRGGLGPVEHPGDLVTLDEYMVDLQISMH